MSARVPTPIACELMDGRLRLAQQGKSGWRLAEIPADEPAELRRALRAEGFRGRRAVLAQPVFVHHIRMAPMSEAERAEAVRWEVAELLPFPATAAAFRQRVLARVREEGQDQDEVLVLAAPEADIDRALARIEAAGLRPLAVDPDVCALARAALRGWRDQEVRLVVGLNGDGAVALVLHGRELGFVKRMAWAWQAQSEPGTGPADDLLPERPAPAGPAQAPELVHDLRACLRYHDILFPDRPVAEILLVDARDRRSYYGDDLEGGLPRWLQRACGVEARWCAPVEIELENPARLRSPGQRPGGWFRVMGAALWARSA